MSCRRFRSYDSTSLAWIHEGGRLAIVSLTLFAIGLFFGPVSLAQLPNESELPDASNPTNAPVPTEEALPSTTPKAQVPSADVSEEALPPGVGAAPAKNDAGDADERGDMRPILRLAFDGHTGPIRTITMGGDGQWIASAGEDKDVHIWSPQASTPTGWFHRRTIHWQVSRSQRGRVYTVASQGNEVAFAGYGAMAGNGEIWIVDAISGNLKQTLVDYTDGHRQVVLTLAWAPDGSSRLVSADIDGKVILWQKDENTGQWSHRTLVEEDLKKYGDAWAEFLKSSRAFVPVCWLGSDTVAIPSLKGVSTTVQGVSAWDVELHKLGTGQTAKLAQPEITGNAVSFTASKDGKRLITSDLWGNCTVVRFDANGAVVSTEKIATDGAVVSAAISNNGNRLYLGTFNGAPNGPLMGPSIQCWSISDTISRRLSFATVSGPVKGITASENPKQIIAAIGNRLQVHDLDERDNIAVTPRGSLAAPAGPIFDVKFHNTPDRYEVAFASELASDGTPILRHSFDLKDVRLQPFINLQTTSFVPRQRLSSKWSAEDLIVTEGAGAGKFSRLTEANLKRGTLPLVESKDGVPTAIATLAVTNEDPTQAGDAVIVGTNGENNIYVYRADESDPPKLLRQFRGHAGAVLALSTSPDGRYLASCSEDATIAVWKLEDLFSASENENRWGVDFEIQNDRLIAVNVRDDGPLYFRGVRGGDQLIGIKWSNAEGTEELIKSNPAEMLEYLQTLRFDTQVWFDFSRLGRPLPGFQSFPAWQPLATLFVDKNREWAFWTPAGFYNASINGHQHFGWQINRGERSLPDYYRAAQFREKLERPAVMQRLLEQGSLDRAMRATVGAIGPPPGDDAIVNQINNKPSIEILSPAPGEILKGDQIDVTAKISVPLGATLAPPKAFCGGVPAIDRVLVSDNEVDTDNSSLSRELTYRWTMRLPSEPLLKLEVIAATEASAVDRVVADFTHEFDKPDLPPRLHVLAIGVSDYRDRQIQSLDFAARATDVVANLFRSTASPLYRVTTDQLVDRDATRPLWRVYANQAAEELAKTVSPNDLVVMYLCGHGLRDRLTGQWYFVTSDARYNDLMNDRYDDCLSFSDLGALSTLPCRKLAILDSCHSGAVQPMMRSDDLKSALRFLQDDVVLTMTASEGDEEAAEQRETKLGRFTTELVSALNGEADRQGNGNGVVTLRETIDFVTRRVSEQAAKEGAAQHPTASPEYLLESLELPLAKVK